MNSFISMSDFGFAIIFSAIVLAAAIPKAMEFWQKVQNSKSDNMLKWQMLELGASAEDIVQSISHRTPQELRWSKW